MKLFLQTHVWALGGQMMLGEGREGRTHITKERQRKRGRAQIHMSYKTFIYLLFGLAQEK